MSSTQLLALGVVRMSAPVHGYDVRRTLPRESLWTVSNTRASWFAKLE